MSTQKPIETFGLHLNEYSCGEFSDSDDGNSVDSYLNNLEEILSELRSKSSEFALAQYDHFEDLRRQIDIRRETLVDNINKISKAMISQVEESEIEFKKNSFLNHLNYDQEVSRLKTVPNTSPKFKVQYDSILQEIQDRLKHFENKKETLGNYKFETNGNFVSESFGFLNLDKKYINLITCSSTDLDSSYISDLDREINVFNLNTNSVIKTLSGHKEMVYCLEIYQKTKLVSGSADKTLKVWDLKTGTCLKTLAGHLDEVRCAKILSNDLLASGSLDKTVKIWKLDSGTCIHTLEGHTSRINAIENLSNKFLASSSNDSTIKIWNLYEATCVNTLKEHTETVLCMKVLCDNKLASGSYDKTIKIWNIDLAYCVRSLKGHSNSITSLEWLKDKDWLISCSHDTTIKVWDLKSGTCVRTLYGHNSSIYCIKLNLDEMLISGSYNGHIKMWDVSTGKCLRTISNKTFVGDLQLCNF